MFNLPRGQKVLFYASTYSIAIVHLLPLELT